MKNNEMFFIPVKEALYAAMFKNTWNAKRATNNQLIHFSERLIVAKFSNISFDVVSQNDLETEYGDSVLKNIPSIIPETEIILNDSSNISSENSASSLGLGIVIGIIIGITISVVCIFIIRQKPSK